MGAFTLIAKIIVGRIAYTGIFTYDWQKFLPLPSLAAYQPHFLHKYTFLQYDVQPLIF